MTDTKVTLTQKILDDEVGVRSQDADELYHVEGKKRLAIVELESYDFAHGAERGDRVSVRIIGLELIPPDQEAFARDFKRSIYQARTPAPLDPDLGQESVDDTAERGRRMLMCETCLHPRADHRIEHTLNHDADGAFCTWVATGTEVETGQEEPPAIADDEQLVDA